MSPVDRKAGNSAGAKLDLYDFRHHAGDFVLYFGE